MWVWLQEGLALAASPAAEMKFRRAFDAHFEAVGRYCARRLPPGDAGDAISEVFAVAWRRVDQMPEGENTLPWLYGVARNVVRNMTRSSRRRMRLRSRLSSQAQPHSISAEALALSNAAGSTLIGALQSLKTEDQEVLRLRAYEGMTASEIAIALGCSRDAAKKRVTRALQRLRHAAGLTESERPRSSAPRELERGEP